MAQRTISTTFSLREGVTGRLADDSEQATGLRKDELDEESRKETSVSTVACCGWTGSVSTTDARVPFLFFLFFTNNPDHI